MPEWLEQAFHGDADLPPKVLLVRLTAAFAMGCLAATIHELTRGRGRGKTDRSFLATLVLLGVLIALVTLVIGSNLARAFSLAGALSIVRFRTILEDTRDTAFVIYAVVAGMAAGTGHIMGALICTPLVLIAAWVLRPRQDEPIPTEGLLVLRLGAGRPPDESIEAVLKKHLVAHRLTALATARGGSALDVTYAVRLPGPEQVFALVNELSRLEGIQGVEMKER